MPAKAGIQKTGCAVARSLGTRLRGCDGDGVVVGHPVDPAPDKSVRSKLRTYNNEERHRCRTVTIAVL